MKKSDIQETQDRIYSLKSMLSVFQEQVTTIENKISYLSKRIGLEEEIFDLELNEKKYKVKSNDIIISDIQNDIQNKLMNKKDVLSELIKLNEKK